jgi:hypothetical protein
MLNCLLVAQRLAVFELKFHLVEMLSLKRTKSLRFKWLASAVRTLRFQLFHLLDAPRTENLLTVRTFERIYDREETNKAFESFFHFTYQILFIQKVSNI